VSADFGTAEMGIQTHNNGGNFIRRPGQPDQKSKTFETVKTVPLSFIMKELL